MSAYELTLILKPEMSDDQVDIFTDKLGVTVTGVQKLGKRMFAFPIKNHKEGTYILCDLTAETSKMKALNQALRINDSVLRHLLIEKED